MVAFLLYLFQLNCMWQKAKQKKGESVKESGLALHKFMVTNLD